MHRLTDQQIEHIAQRLDQHNLHHAVLRDELLDHLCCEVEHGLAAGMSYAQCVDRAFVAFGEDGIQNLESETISILHQNSITMKKMIISLAAALILVTGSLMAWSQMDPPSIPPIEGSYKVSSQFGWRIHPISKEKKMHRGIDIIGAIGTPIRATADGTVEKAEYHEGYGYHVVIRHDDAYQSLYGQMTSDLPVTVGQRVRKGEVIGYLGSSGRSTGPHLHYEVLKDGEHVDPKEYLEPPAQ